MKPLILTCLKEQVKNKNAAKLKILMRQLLKRPLTLPGNPRFNVPDATLTPVGIILCYPREFPKFSDVAMYVYYRSKNFNYEDHDAHNIFHNLLGELEEAVAMDDYFAVAPYCAGDMDTKEFKKQYLRDMETWSASNFYMLDYKGHEEGEFPPVFD